KNIDKGIRYLERALARQPGNLSVMANLGAAYFHQGRLEEAAQLLEDVCSANGQNLGALFNLAQIRDELGDRDRAIRLYRRFHDLAGGRPEFAQDLRKVRRRLKQLTGSKPPRR
ncbi:MAG: tetratricopeptide repeat protein, partial [Acidobacteriota bacterium]|nr:tetratricopeptide repeat protein [Acidobacteriota bacterium]